jgi:two-component system NtrC family sensor kinase
MKYQRAIDYELSQRLKGSAQEVGVLISQIKNSLQAKRDRYIKDPSFIYHLIERDQSTLTNIASNWMKNDVIAGLSLFDREGRLVASVYKDQKNAIQSFIPAQDAIFLSAKYISTLKEYKEIELAEFNKEKKVSLILISRVQGVGGKTIGYLEQIHELRTDFAVQIKNRLKLEVALFSDNGEIAVASHSDFYLHNKNFFKPYFERSKEPFFDLKIGSKPLGFLTTTVDWGITKFYLALGASKSEANAVLRNVNLTFMSVVGAVIMLLFFTILVASKLVLKPLYELVEALQSFE